MNDAEREAFLMAVHTIADDTATRAAAAFRAELVRVAPTYPPDAAFTLEEFEALNQTARHPSIETAIAKVMADAIGTALFQVFAVIDGVGDPPDYDGHWPQFELTPVKGKTRPFLHDDLFASYWDWLEHHPSV